MNFYVLEQERVRIRRRRNKTTQFYFIFLVNLVFLTWPLLENLGISLLTQKNLIQNLFKIDTLHCCFKCFKVSYLLSAYIYWPKHHTQGSLHVYSNCTWFETAFNWIYNWVYWSYINIKEACYFFLSESQVTCLEDHPSSLTSMEVQWILQRFWTQ